MALCLNQIDQPLCWVFSVSSLGPFIAVWHSILRPERLTLWTYQRTALFSDLTCVLPVGDSSRRLEDCLVLWPHLRSASGRLQQETGGWENKVGASIHYLLFLGVAAGGSTPVLEAPGPSSRFQQPLLEAGAVQLHDFWSRRCPILLLVVSLNLNHSLYYSLLRLFILTVWSISCLNPDW